MPIYEIELPDGGILEVEGPEGASDDQLIQVAKDYVSAAERPAEVIPEGPGMLERAGQQVVGTGETAATMLSGATAGTLGGLGSMLKGLAEEIIAGKFGTSEAATRLSDATAKGIQAGTYAPRTEAGQEQVEALGELTAPLAGVGPLAETMALAGAVPTAAQAVIAPARQAASQAAKQVPTHIKDVVDKLFEAKPTPGTGQSAGAMAVDKATQRRTQAGTLPVPMSLTEGQATRNFDQQRWERETAKTEIGAPLRERFDEHNAQLQQNVDAFIDDTGSEITDLRGVGEIVDDALKTRYRNDKTRVNVLYKEAEKSGEMQEKINLDELVKFLNESTSAESTAPILKAARNELVRLGGAIVDQEGNLKTGKTPPKQREVDWVLSKLNEELEGAESVAAAKDIFADVFMEAETKFGDIDLSTIGINDLGDSIFEAYYAPTSKGGTISLNDSEQLRKFINANTNFASPDAHYAPQLKGLIDQATEGKGGAKYLAARKARQRLASDYEDVSLAKKLLSTELGSKERDVALEDVLRKTIIDPGTSLDEMRHIRKLLQTKTGEKGKQAWKELQGGTLRHIQDQMLKGISTDEAGNRIVSPAQLDRVITQLDKTGKLDYVFGPPGANQLRLINDVAKDVMTSPPGAVNTSNTATVLAGLMDVAISGTTGVPAPIMTSFRMLSKSIKDAKLKARVKKALGEQP